MLSIPPHKERKPCFNTLFNDNLGKFWHIRLGDRWWRCYADSLRLEPTDQKVYLLNEFWEGWGGYKLYYFDLKGKNPHKLIEAKSYYHKDKQGGTDDDPIFMAKLTHLQQRLPHHPEIRPQYHHQQAHHLNIPPCPPTQNVSSPNIIINTTLAMANTKAHPSRQPPPTIAPILQPAKPTKSPSTTRCCVVEYLDELMKMSYTTEHLILLNPKSTKVARR